MASVRCLLYKGKFMHGIITADLIDAIEELTRIRPASFDRLRMLLSTAQIEHPKLVEGGDSRGAASFDKLRMLPSTARLSSPKSGFGVSLVERLRMLS